MKLCALILVQFINAHPAHPADPWSYDSYYKSRDAKDVWCSVTNPSAKVSEYAEFSTGKLEVTEFYELIKRGKCKDDKRVSNYLITRKDNEKERIEMKRREIETAKKKCKSMPEADQYGQISEAWFKFCKPIIKKGN